MRNLALAALLAAAVISPALAAPEFDQVDAGHYQAILGDCDGCHTQQGGSPLAGGVALQTPFGILVTPNITMDRDTGIGAWTQDDFRRAMKQGIAPHGKRLYPAMPYPAYARMTDADVDALWAYLQTVQPVRHSAGANRLAFPYNIRGLMAVWNSLNFRPTPFKTDPGKSQAWNRGAYIVTGAAHCGACHTPKTMLGADKGQAMTGASLQGWFAPDISANKSRGIGAWSTADIVQYLWTGRNWRSIASGPMAEVVENSTSKMTDADLKAIAIYLKAQPASTGDQGAVPSAADVHMKAGAIIYQDNCAACHGGDGKGERGLFPPLAGNAIVQQTSAETLARVVLAGSQAVHTRPAPTAPAMPSFAWRLNDAQVADMLTYIRNSWGNAAAPVSAGAIRTIRADLRDGR